jgi:basic membrane protein A and related proteins
MDEPSVINKSKFRKNFIKVISIFTELGIGLLIVGALFISLQSVPVQAAPVNVGLILYGDAPENSLNWNGIQGLLRAETDFGVVGTVYTSTDPTEIIIDAMKCAMDLNDVCIGIGWMTAEAISTTAPIYTGTKFVNIDGTYPNYPPNLRAVTFASEDAGYLAGTLAAMLSQSEILGDLGGMEIPPVTAFTQGFKNGAQCADPGITTIISYTNDFGNPDLGAQYAQGMIAQGADVVFAAAGGTGDGAILTTTQSGVWAIGVDTDQYLTLFESGVVTGSNFLLTSAMKNYDNAVFYTISDVVSGDFTPGIILYGVGVDGVGLAPFHETEEFVPSGVRTWLDWVTRAIAAERIAPLDPESPCLVMYQTFLPLARR